MDVLENLEELIFDKEKRVSLLPTERYGMVTETYVPNDIHSIVHSIFFIRTNIKGLLLKGECVTTECKQAKSEVSKLVNFLIVAYLELLKQFLSYITLKATYVTTYQH